MVMQISGGVSAGRVAHAQYFSSGGGLTSVLRAPRGARREAAAQDGGRIEKWSAELRRPGIRPPPGAALPPPGPVQPHPAAPGPLRGCPGGGRGRRCSRCSRSHGGGEQERQKGENGAGGAACTGGWAAPLGLLCRRREVEALLHLIDLRLCFFPCCSGPFYCVIYVGETKPEPLCEG